jgi:glycosyltransferase involved in cell wall biosynthesis
MGGMSLSLIERARLAGIRAVGFVHDDWMLYGPRVDQAGSEVDLGAAGRWVFVSDHTRRRACAAHALPDTAVAHSGIDHRWIGAATPPHPWRGRLLYVGRIDERKGLQTAIEALGHLPSEPTLTVVGAGEVAPHPQVVHAGARPRDELPAFYADCDAVVFPAIWEEPWGLVPLEAMALGRPVVATGRGGSGEYLRDGENALLFAMEDARALADALRRLARDDALRTRLRAGGAATAALHIDTVFDAAVERHLHDVAGR